MKPYQLVIDWDALEILRSRPKAEQRAVARLVEELRANPFREETLAESDAVGRSNQIALVEDLLVHYWADHAERTLRIALIEVV